MSHEELKKIPIPGDGDAVDGAASTKNSTIKRRNTAVSFSNETNLDSSKSVSQRGRTRSRGSSIGKFDLQGDTMPLLNDKYYSKKTGGNAPFLEKTITINKENFWIIPLILFLSIQGLFYISGNHTESNPLFKFVGISYYDENTGLYAKGINDLAFVFTYIVFFTFFRDFIMFMVIRPITINLLHVYKTSKVNRMMEQCYSMVYYGISGPMGLLVMKYSSNLWLFNTENMYKSYPDIQLNFYFKMFYLVQAAFWIQQASILVLQLEKPRKDYQELIFHHIITLLLIWCSYVFHFHQMGLSIYITMDVSDFFLSLSKVLNYLESIFVTPAFLLFIGFWIYLRHYINLKILYSMIWEFKEVGPYVLDFAQQQYKCWIARPIIFLMIFSLQCLNLFWLFLILRILFRLLFLGVQKDERSDSESDEEEEVKEKMD